MDTPGVVIVETGVANTASVAAAIERCGGRAELTRDPQIVAVCDRAVLPGVGAFGAGMDLLTKTGLGEAVHERTRNGRPLLAVCLGMQMLGHSSDESPGVSGLGIVNAVFKRFGPGVRTPQFGWNRVDPDPLCDLVAPGYAYFANSYRLVSPPAGWRIAWAEHGGRFVAAMEREGILACQFHPELSGPWGIELLGRWLARAGRGRVAC